MNKTQWISIAGAAVLFSLLYFGCNTKPENIKGLEKTRTLAAEKTSAAVLMKNAKAKLPNAELASLELLEQEFVNTTVDSIKINYGKQLSGRWFELKQPAISGHFAQEVASLENEENSWSIAGTTYALCVQRSQDEVEKDFCSKRAVESFENAISLNPSESAHKLNLALVYADNPPEGQPMKGIQMLLTLNREQPENVTVIKTLARLGLQTGQFEKVLARLTKAKALAPNDREIDCMLVKVYTATNETALAEQAAVNCNR